MISIAEAHEIIRGAVGRTEITDVALADSVGYVLAGPVFADRDLPPFDRSQMDGFAVRSEDCAAPAELSVVGESVAGKRFDRLLARGEAVRIMTGAPLPDGADAVQQVEKTRSDGDRVVIDGPVSPGLNIVRKAAEIRSGTLVFESGTTITAGMIASLASFGLHTVRARRKPSVEILATGSEIVDVSERPGRDQIRNSNSPMLAAFVRSLGVEPVVHPIVSDDLEELTETVAEISRRRPDFLLITGGVSVGDYDFTKPALTSAGAEIFFEKVRLKPGKPTVFGRLGKTLVFGLPGNPVSVAVTFFLFVRFAMMLMQDSADPELRTGTAVASGRIKGAVERDCLIPVSLSTTPEGKMSISAVRFTGSSDFVAFARAEALAYVPAGNSIAADETATIHFLNI